MYTHPDINEFRRHWWSLKFNTEKCHLLRFHRTRRPFDYSYKLCGHTLRKLCEHSYLGILMSTNLKWAIHIKQITQKANEIIGLLRRNLTHCPQKLREIAYFLFVRPTIEYCSTIWSPYYKKDIANVEKMQRRSARFVRGDFDWRSSVSKMLDELGWPK